MKDLKTKITALLKGAGFDAQKPVNEVVSESFGDQCYDFAVEGLVLRVLSDRGQIFFDVSLGSEFQSLTEILDQLGRPPVGDSVEAIFESFVANRKAIRELLEKSYGRT